MTDSRGLAMPGGGWRRASGPDGLCLGAVTVVAFALNAWGLSENEYGNTYYSAAYRSMTFSWRNFFFVSYDPGGFLSIEKPPVFLWIGAASVRVFGYSSWSILLPSALAGAASVALLWAIVRKHFGRFAATTAALVLALSPISVAVNRLNMPEPFLMLVLLGAAGALLQSFERKRWWAWVALAGVLVGLGFNTKMLAAWIPGPAFALAVIVAMPRLDRPALTRCAVSLGILGAATLAVSGSWTVVVDAVPADSRPYIGGSTDNSVRNLILHYNGIGRVERDARPFGSGGSLSGRGGIVAGEPGPLRMFDEANGPQIAWLLPLALLAGPIAAWRWRNDPKQRAAAVLFLGWLVMFGVVFSRAEGVFHAYYTSAMAPGIAAAAGIGVAALLDLAKRDRRWLIAFAAIALATVLGQLRLAERVPDFFNWLPWAGAAIVGAGIVLLAVPRLGRQRWGAAPGFAVVILGLLVTPAGWSVFEASYAPLNKTLPQGGPREGAAGQSFGSRTFDSDVADLARWLDEQPAARTRWDIAVVSAQHGSELAGRHRLSVMAIGGYSGTDPTISVIEFAEYVGAADVRYVLAPAEGATPGAFGGERGAKVVMASVRAACAPVGEAPSAFGASLYDCEGKGEELKALGG